MKFGFAKYKKIQSYITNLRKNIKVHIFLSYNFQLIVNQYGKINITLIIQYYLLLTISFAFQLMDTEVQV